jgi:hypothetical protein
MKMAMQKSKSLMELKSSAPPLFRLPQQPLALHAPTQLGAFTKRLSPIPLNEETESMSLNYSPNTNFGLLPEHQSSPASFISSMLINGLVLALLIYIGATARRVIEEHRYEETVLIVPSTPPPPVKIKIPEPPKIKPPEPPKLEVKLDAPKINMPKPEVKPDLKPIQMEAKVALPAVKEAKPSVILAPQPKAALTAAMPAQTPQVKPSTAPVHLGDTFGVTPNPNATRPATVAAIGNPYGGMQGPAVAPHGIVGSTGIGNSTTRSGSNSGVVGKVASAGVPGATGTSRWPRQRFPRFRQRRRFSKWPPRKLRRTWRSFPNHQSNTPLRPGS